MSSRPGSRQDHNTFCRREKWDEVRNARGKKVGHHLTYELPLPSGKVLRTRISRPVNAATYGPSLWATILREQLDVAEDEFWACVDDGKPPRREDAPIGAAQDALPLQVVRQLQKLLHLSETQIAALDLNAAMALLTEHWSQPPN